jgi:isopenicillin N synthase-like dioxygenase
MTEDSVPILDLDEYRAGGPPRQRFLLEAERAVRNVGFFGYVHPVFLQRSVISTSLDRANGVFDLPREIKAQFVREELGKQRGITLDLGEVAAGLITPDHKEFWHVGRQYGPEDPMYQDCGDNVPVGDLVPGFDVAVQTFYNACDAESDIVLDIFSDLMGLETTFLRTWARGGDDLLRILHYLPADPDSACPDADWGGAHEDIDLVTLLTSDTEDGLWVKSVSGVWAPVRIPTDGVMVNTGEMMTHISGGHFSATTHAVRKPADPTKHRRSQVYFKHPRRDVILTYLAQALGRPIRTFEDMCEGYALFKRLIQNRQYMGTNPYLRMHRDPSVPPLVQRAA